jgi:hypothetical protein
VGLGKRAVEDLPADVAFRRLESLPEPAAVRDRGFRKVGRSGGGKRAGGAFLGPSQILVQRVAVEPLKGLDADAGVGENVVNALRVDHDGLARSEGGQSHGRCQQRTGLHHNMIRNRTRFSSIEHTLLERQKHCQ